MPKVSEFHGIVIAMYRREHGPPHFHAIYGEHQALIGIDPIVVMKGHLPRRILRLVLAWAELHGDELAHNWQRAVSREPLVRIAPLR